MKQQHEGTEMTMKDKTASGNYYSNKTKSKVDSEILTVTQGTSEIVTLASSKFRERT